MTFPRGLLTRLLPGSLLVDWGECRPALAHTVSNKVEAAYRRTDFLDKRRLLMRD